MDNKYNLSYKLILIAIFSIAMGLLESAVVVYLRKLYYPGGFEFPIILTDITIARTEFFRELATMIMLVCIGLMSGKTKLSKFAWFLYSFAIWDIFYYVFLKALLNWPASLLTDDILFLLPVVWIGPVYAPVLISFCMIGLALIILYSNSKGKEVQLNSWHWVLFISGSLIVITAFAWEFGVFAAHNLGLGGIFVLPGNATLDLLTQFIPMRFNTALFFMGLVVILSPIIQLIFTVARIKK